MRVVHIQENLDHGDVLRLHHLTDLHVGAPDFDEEAFLGRRALIEQDPLARWTMGGDGGDLIRHNDRRYQPTELAERYRMATDIRHATQEHLVELLSPIAEKCWAYLDGNHERKLDEHYGGHFGVETACKLGLEDKFLGYRGFVKLTFHLGTARLNQLLDLQHGWQSGRLKGAFLVQAERELGASTATVVLRGHNHQPAAHTFQTLDVQCGQGQPRIRPVMRTVINGGCWRTGYRDDLAPANRDRLSEFEGDMWGETKGYRAEPVGGPVLLLTVDRGTRERPGRGRGRSACVKHTIVEGHIDAQKLGLALSYATDS